MSLEIEVEKTVIQVLDPNTNFAVVLTKIIGLFTGTETEVMLGKEKRAAAGIHTAI